MRVLVVDGSSSSDESVKAICHMLEDVLTVRNVPHETVHLDERRIVPCKRCGSCWVETPGLCVEGDDSNELNRSWMYADMVVLLTRMTYGCYSSRIKDLLDKRIGSSVPYMSIKKDSVCHGPRYERNPSILSIAVCDELNHSESETFKMLAKQIGGTINSYNSKSMIIWSGQRADDLRPMIDSAVMAMKVRA
ncbi:MAG: NAD(P)H-dependent oxidoreductase [Euryarchaeota archaeon]|nr:NAD(P)H-dependent oxidoreductase [Euryarchaeota archaeon]